MNTPVFQERICIETRFFLTNIFIFKALICLFLVIGVNTQHHFDCSRVISVWRQQSVTLVIFQCNGDLPPLTAKHTILPYEKPQGAQECTFHICTTLLSTNDWISIQTTLSKCNHVLSSFHCILPHRIKLSRQGLDNVYTSLYKLTSDNIYIM